MPQVAYPPPVPSIELYTYLYAFYPPGQNPRLILFGTSSRASLANSMMVPDLDDPKEWEKLKNDESSNTQQK